MLINEAGKITKLTKKAIEYYTLQGLVSPTVLENGYREYNQQDIKALQKISILRRLDVSTQEIKDILADKTNLSLQMVSMKKELEIKQGELKKAALQKLSVGKTYEEIALEIKAIEEGATITEKLLEAFPGYYGRFICMHFVRFLNEPIKTKVQEAAYSTVISFLDGVPMMEIPQDLEEYLIEGTKHIGTKEMADILAESRKSMENPDGFLMNNKEMIEEYLEYKQSEEYKNSPAARLMELVKAFNTANGYNDIFIPAMKKLSSSYSEYSHQMEAANQKLLKQYPEIEKLTVNISTTPSGIATTSD